MSISEKSKPVNNKIDQNKAQYNLDRQTAKSSALSLENVIKYQFFIGKDVSSKKNLSGKPTAIKRFEYSPLSKEFKKWTNFAEKQYKEFESNKIEEKVKRRDAKSNLVYDNYFTLLKYSDTKESTKRSIGWKLNELNQFKNKLESFYFDTEQFKPVTKDTNKDLEDIKIVINKSFNLYDKL